MMGMPVPINMMFPKIQEEFKKIVDSQVLERVSLSFEENGVKVFSPSGEFVLITPDMDYERVLVAVDEIKEILKNGE